MREVSDLEVKRVQLKEELSEVENQI